ncbi:hypothetical protein [Faecalibacter sp. LW9]|uniref:toxin-antitoxin system YwqK family antitoxin n=1 Tax=Faecalibacter sp. LW9 TaxID=3103144 RepID=UPI002AFE2039|nr:hypothetical protein [Faecalibacter sp. LW9]
MKLKFNLYLGVFLITSLLQLQAQSHYQEIIRYENKKIKSVFTYNSNHQLDGETIHYYPNGLEKSVINYKNDKVDGEVMNFYSNGMTESVGTVTQDLANGQFEYFHENGKPKQKIVYYNNLVVGILDCYLPNGDKVYCGVINSGNGFINIYDRKGNVVAKDIFKEGKMVERKYVE